MIKMATTPLSLFCWLCIVIQVSLAAVSCRRGWTRFQNACYLISNEKGSWAEAVVFCQAIHSQLADVQSRDENDFLISFVKQKHSTAPITMYWLAGTDTVIEGEWQWITTGEPFSFMDWSPGEPNNNVHGNCMGMLNTENYHWNDADCKDYTFPFICKTRLEEPEVAIG